MVGETLLVSQSIGRHGGVRWFGIQTLDLVLFTLAEEGLLLLLFLLLLLLLLLLSERGESRWSQTEHITKYIMERVHTLPFAD